jgi:YVTN family beta-propeller protein
MAGDPSAVVFSADHKLAFVVLSNGTHVAVIDTTTRLVVNYIEILPVTVDALIFLDRSGQRLYVTSCTDPAISVIDVKTQRMTAAIALPGGSYPMAFSPNGQTGYAGNGYDGCGPTNGVHRLNLETSTVSGFISTTLPVSDVAVSPNGALALATGADHIAILDLTTNTQVGTVACGPVRCSYGFSSGVAFNAAGTRAYTVDYTGDTLSTIDTDHASPSFGQELSRVAVPVRADADFWLDETPWQITVRQDRAFVVAIGFPGKVVSFDISTDNPVVTNVDPVGNFSYELDVWTLPSSIDECMKNAWKNFRFFKNQGDCVGFVASKTKNQPALLPPR